MIVCACCSGDRHWFLASPRIGSQIVSYRIEKYVRDESSALLSSQQAARFLCFSVSCSLLVTPKNSPIRIPHSLCSPLYSLYIPHTPQIFRLPFCATVNTWAIISFSSISCISFICVCVCEFWVLVFSFLFFLSFCLCVQLTKKKNREFNFLA